MEAPRSPGRKIQPVLSLLRHWRVSVVLAILVVLVGAPFAWVKGRSSWNAEAVFQVAPYFQKNVSIDREMELQSNSQYREFVNHLSRSVLRYDTVLEALKRVRAKDVDPCPAAFTERRCAEHLQRTMYVMAIGDTYMVRVGLNSINQEEPDKLVNAVMNVFLEVTQDEQIFGSDERTRMLAARTRQLRQELAEFAVQRDKKAAVLGLTTFGENTTNAYDAVLAQARERAMRAGAERSQAQAMLDAFRANREVPMAAGRSVLDMRLQDNGLQALRNEVVKRSEELGRTLRGLEDAHPAKSPAVSEQQEIAARLEQKEGSFEKDARVNVMARLQATLQQAQQVEREARTGLKDIEGRATEFAATFREAMHITSELKKREQELNELRDRSNFLQAERRALGFVRLVSAALPPEVPQGLGRTRLAAVVLLAALALALLAPMALDLADRRVLVPADAERVMDMPAAGWVVRRDNAATQMLADDQIKRLASMMLRQKRQTGRTVFGFTSARVGGGTTSLVHELADTLDVLGTRVLVVDANSLSRRTVEQAAAETPVCPTLVDLLTGAASADQVVGARPGGRPSVGRVACGPLAAQGLQRLDRLHAAVAAWSGQWDLVLFDVAPILPSADAELLVEALGQVFVVAEAASLLKSDLSLVKSALQRLDPAGVGLIVTRVPAAGLGADWLRHAVEHITGSRYDRFSAGGWKGLRLAALRSGLPRG